MNALSIANSRGAIVLSTKLYGWGITISITGGLLLLHHVQSGTIFLTLGGIMIGISYLQYGYKLPHFEPDWSLVYPELACVHCEPEKNTLDEIDSMPSKQDAEKIEALIKKVEELTLEVNRLKEHSK